MFKRTYRVTLQRPTDPTNPLVYETRFVNVKAWTARQAGYKVILEVPGFWGLANVERIR